MKMAILNRAIGELRDGCSDATGQIGPWPRLAAEPSCRNLVAVPAGMAEAAVRRRIDAVLSRARARAADHRAGPRQATNFSHAAELRRWREFMVCTSDARDIAELESRLGELLGDGWAILCGTPWLRRIAGACHGQTVWVGRDRDCQVAAVDVCYRPGRLRFQVADQKFTVSAWSGQELNAALAAIAVGRIVGLELGEIAAALAGPGPAPEDSLWDPRGVTGIEHARVFMTGERRVA